MNRSRESAGSGLLGSLAGDDGRPENAFRPFVGGLDAILLQEPQQVAAVVLWPYTVQQLLIIDIRQDAVTEMIGQLPMQLLRTFFGSPPREEHRAPARA